MEKILVIGANGSTGNHIVNLLQHIDRYHVKVMLRKQNQAENFAESVEVYIGDLEENFEDAFKHVDKVIFAAGSGSSTGDDKTIAIDQEGAKRAVDYAEQHNLKKFVMLSSMGTDAPEKVKGLETYLKAKKNADDYLKKSSLNFSIAKPGSLTNKEATNAIKLVEGSVNGEISREDVAYVLVKCLQTDVCKNKSFGFITGETDIDDALKQM